LEKGLLGTLSKLGKDANDMEIVGTARVDSSVDKKRSYVFNYYSVRTKDGKELFKVIGMVVAEEDYVKAQEELADLFSQGRGDMCLILSGRGVVCS
jgi:hypothetical protein